MTRHPSLDDLDPLRARALLDYLEGWLPSSDHNNITYVRVNRQFVRRAVIPALRHALKEETHGHTD